MAQMAPAKKPSRVRMHAATAAQLSRQKIAAFKAQSWAERHRTILRGLGLAGLVLVFVAVGFALLVSQYPLASVSVAGYDVGPFTTAPQLKSQLDAQVKAYQVTITDPEGQSQTYPLSETGIAVDTAASALLAVRTKQPANLLARLKVWQKQRLALQTTVDETVLQKFIQDHGTQTAKPAVNAAIAVNNGTVTVNPEATGEGYTFNGGGDALRQAVQQLQTKPLVLQKQTLPPAISAAQAEPVAQKIRQLLAQPAVFTINGRTIKATAADVGGWLDIAPSEAQHTIDYSVNSGKVLSYLNTIAKRYVTPPVTQITMPDGSILIPGVNGVDITNKESTAAAIAQKLMANQPVQQDLPVQFAAFKTMVATPHDKWLVVDITTKRMYAYQQTELVKTFLISAGAPATPTVTGEYKIYSKHAVQDMRGANADGSRYFQPNVRYVNYFYADYAIHGNYWRPVSYFGNVNSSHGCVGVLDVDAQWVYNWAPIGTTVIVHR